MDSRHRRFRTFALITTLAVYFLILVGGIVRASGAGMGCPDWPKCFGRWVPPTSVEQLPADYQETYAHRGYENQPFNAVKTWTEYVNRLVGVTIGFLIFLTLLASAPFWRTDRAITWWAAVAFVLVGFQGWLGSVVVSTNLAPWMVTVHMVLALVIVFILTYAWARAHGSELPRSLERRPLYDWGLPALLLLSLSQVVLGTQVRERIDELGQAGVARGDWIGQIGAPVLVHRTLSLLILAVNVWLILRLRRESRAASVPSIVRIGDLILAMLGLEVVVGAVLFYFAVPAALQPVHLLLGSLVAGGQYALVLLYRYASGHESRTRAAVAAVRAA